MSDHIMLGEDELAFERLLLGAGRTETLPRELAEAALSRFVAGISAVQGDVGDAMSNGGSTSGVGAREWSRLVGTTKWLALGAILGGVATFAWLGPRATPRSSTAPVAASVSVELVQSAPEARQLRGEAEASPASTPSQAAPFDVGRPPSRTANVGTSPRPTARPALDLAAEVTALDAIRTAISIGAWRNADELLASYRREFAHGALRSEAEVLALEVLVARGRKQAAAKAAERFIFQHPRDPQVARVRALIEGQTAGSPVIEGRP